ncbi:MAG: prepilin peptidase, partial [bacterium]|nr:prepilin peptidase [bacterium]
MNTIQIIILFGFGVAIGSFINVIFFRYNPENFILSKKILGRSKCQNCKKILSWYELIPILSFIFQLGRCRSCKQKLSLQYPIIEFLCGLIFIGIPLYFKKNIFIFFTNTNFNSLYFYGLILIWIIIFLILILI